MHAKHDTLDAVARYRIGRDILRFVVRCGIAVDAIEDALAREITPGVRKS